MGEFSAEHDGRIIINCNDDDAARYLITRILTLAGYTVREASTGEQALELAREGAALVVLDVNLPELSGLEVCRRLKSDPVTAGIPVLQTSAVLVTPERTVEGLESGADGYLTQPVDPNVLIATVRALLRARHAEDGMMAAARTWQSTFDAIADGLAIIDEAGRIEHANVAMLALPGRDQREVLGAACGETLFAVFGDESSGLLAPCDASGRRVQELAARGRWYRIAVDPVDADGRRVVVIISDISDLKRLEEVQRLRNEELMEADRRKDEFLAMLAHELRNPLSALAAANSLADHVGPQDPENVRLRAMVSKQTRHLSRLVDDLLEVSRVTRGQIKLQRAPTDLRGALRQAVQAVRPLIDSKQQSIELQLPDQPVIVDGDVFRLEQAFVNVIGNAAKYTGIGGRIEVRCQPRAASAHVVVADSGVGIPEDRLSVIFDLFVQLDQSLARSSGGLGIGLTVAKRLIELHGGTIAAASRGEGRGAEFTIGLPTLVSAEAEAPRRGRAGTIMQRQALDVLLIEDNADTRELMRDLIESWGHRVFVAADGDSGLRRALEVRPAVAVIDIGLPGLDGYSVAQHLRSSRSGRDMLLVALTGYGRPEDRARALASGFDIHMVKPVQPEKLQTLLAAPPGRQQPAATHN